MKKRVPTFFLNLDRKVYRRFIRLALTPVVLLGVHGLYYLINPGNVLWSTCTMQTTGQFTLDLLASFFFSWLIIESSIGIADGLEKYLPWSSSPLLRFLMQVMLTLLASASILLVENQVYTWIYPGKLTPKEELETWQFFVISLLVSLMISTVHTGYFLLTRWKNTLEEAAELKVRAMELNEVALQAELQSLKLQLNPHFLFNNFSVLSELILEDTAKASRFLDKLSKVYRYMIQNLKQDLVPLKDELIFVKAYQYLIQIRHGEQVYIQFEIDNGLLSKWIPPITLQLLIENAIKHNRATRTEPLTIYISQIENHLRVSNNLQPLPNPLPSTGLGLGNINNRYKILSCEMPKVGADETLFWVDLPVFDYPQYDPQDG